MAHTNQTVNYGLSQFIGTDIPNPLVDYNGDMEKIDTAIKNVADSSVDDRDDIAALKIQNGNETLTTTAQTLSGAVNELDSEYSDVNTRLAVAEGKITADEGTLSTAVGNISTLSGKVSAVETKVGSAVLMTTAADLSGGVNELYGSLHNGVDSVDAKITALETQNGNAVLETVAQTLSGAINELYNRPAGSVDADDVSYDGTTSGLVATNVQDAIDEVVAGLPASTSEVQSGTLTAGQTSITLTFTEQTIGSTSLVSVFDADDVPYASLSTTGTTATVTFEAQASDMAVSVKVEN